MSGMSNPISSVPSSMRTFVDMLYESEIDIGVHAWRHEKNFSAIENKSLASDRST